MMSDANSVPCARPGAAGCFPYPTQGDQCRPHTIGALTSNDKYIIPLSSVYYRTWTPMARYPGCDSLLVCHPENIKAYDLDRQSCNCSRINAPPMKSGFTKCNSCKSI